MSKKQILLSAWKTINDPKTAAQAERLLYGAAGTLSGIAGGKTARDIQDYYINKPRNWRDKYLHRRFKGDVVVGETDDKFSEAHITDKPSYRYGRNRGKYTTYYRTRAKYNKCSRRSTTRCYCKSRVHRKMG